MGRAVLELQLDKDKSPLVRKVKITLDIRQR